MSKCLIIPLVSVSLIACGGNMAREDEIYIYRFKGQPIATAIRVYGSDYSVDSLGERGKVYTWIRTDKALVSGGWEKQPLSVGGGLVFHAASPPRFIQPQLLERSCAVSFFVDDSDMIVGWRAYF